MKYILKTLDDLRADNQKITDLTLWYILHGICRIYTSRTLISLDVYRVLGGRYSLNELSVMYKDKEISILLCPETISQWKSLTNMVLFGLEKNQLIMLLMIKEN